MRKILLASIIALIGFSAASAQEAYPNRPIRVIMPLPAGSGTDIAMRRLLNAMAGTFPGSFVVENRTGAGGNIGAAAAMKSDPDGYTLFGGTEGTQAANQFLYADQPFDAAKDFTPIVLLFRYGMMAAVGAKSPAKTLQDLIAMAKEKPGFYTAATPSPTGRVFLELLRREAKIDIRNVPYTSSPNAHNDTVRGEVAVVFDSVSAVIGRINNGELRALAVAEAQRIPSLPGTPTFRENGLNIVFGPTNALLAPKGLPRPIVDTLNAAVNKTLQSEDLRAALSKEGADPVGGKPEDVENYYSSQRKVWEAIVKETGIKAQ